MAKKKSVTASCQTTFVHYNTNIWAAIWYNDKTNKMSVHPAKTQISVGIHPVWSESSLVLNG